MSLPRIDRALVGGFPVTSASRTVIDLAALGVTPELLGNAIDSAVRDGHSSPAFLRRRLAALRGSGRRGVQLLDALMLDAGGHTYLERRFLQLLREAGLPRPRCQVVHRRDGRTVARVDFEFVPHPLVVEVSGRRGHVTEADRLRDAKRRNELQLAGIVVVELLSSTVLGDPAAAVAEVRRALRYVGALG
jgi:very-short-patch-repair endonuclease